MTDVMLKKRTELRQPQKNVAVRKMFMYPKASEEKRKNNGEADEH